MFIFMSNGKFNNLTDSFNFDQEFRFLNVLNNKTIKEIPIQTKYGDERSQLHVKYAIKFFINIFIFFIFKTKIINSKRFQQYD